MNNPIEVLFRYYFYFRHRVPIFIYIYYLHFNDTPKRDKGIKTILAIVFFTTAYAIINLFFKSPFSKVIPFNWSYPGLITWGIFFLIYYRISLEKTHNKLKSFTLSILATVGGGWLYEVPFFHPLKMFLSLDALLFVNGQILCLLLLAYELKKMKFKPNIIILESFIIFAFFSIYLFSDFDRLAYMFKVAFDNSRLFAWVYRLPACLFLISLLGGIQNKTES